MCAYKREGGRKALGQQPKLKGVERRKLTAEVRETGTNGRLMSWMAGKDKVLRRTVRPGDG